MIENFEETKRQLKELASVINSYKSEAVQLLIVELVLGSGSPPDDQTPPVPDPAKKKAKPKKKTTPSSNQDPEAKVSRSGSRPGGQATLTRIIGEGYFKKSRTIGEIVSHCDANLALQYQQPSFSGPLARAVRDGKLKRAKNSKNTYEYTEA